MSDWIDFTIVALGITLLVFLVFLYFQRRQMPESRLADDDFSQQELVFGDMTEVLARGMPTGGRDISEIQPQLLRAGYYSPAALIQYRAIRAFMIIVPIIIAGLVTQIVEPRLIPTVAIAGLAIATLGYSLPRVYLAWRANHRTRQIEKGLPVFADLMTLALLAGQNVLNALKRVSIEIRQSYPVIADELELVIRQAELNTLPHAFQQWADRSQVPDVRNLVMVLTQAQRMGTDITSALMEFANNMRTTLRQRADAHAQRAGLWIMFPNIVCLWIPAGVILIAPLAFEFQERRNNSRDALQRSLGGRSTQQVIEKAAQNVDNRPGRIGFSDKPGPASNGTNGAAR